MQAYGEETWEKFKMIPIHAFVEDFDHNYVAWEDFRQGQMDMMKSDFLEQLLRSPVRLKQLEQEWRKEYDKKFLV